jgi:hypothetical protein
MRCTTSLAVLSLLVAACGGVIRPPAPEPVVENQGGHKEVPPNAPGPLLDGPFARLEDSGPMKEADHLAENYSGSGEMRVLARRNSELGEVALVEFRGTASAGYCSVAVRLPDGWYVADDFYCARLTSDGTIEVADVTIEDRGAAVRIQFSLKGDDANGGVGGDGLIDSVTVHAIECVLVEGKPACSPGPEWEA